MASQKQVQTEVVVIGAGPAGYVCAIRLAQLGKKVTVVEKAQLGGVCLNVGCIPSKALIYAGTLFEKIQHASEIGIHVKGASINLQQLQTWKQGVVKKLTGGVGSLLKANGCQVLEGDAKFLNSKSLEVKGKDGISILSFQTAVIATGSRPSQIPGLDVDQDLILDSTGALAQDQLPESLLCVGGGYIGLELGTFYAKIGSKVTVVEAAPQLLGAVDPELTRVVEKNLKKRNVAILLKTKVKECKKSKGGVEVSFEGADGKVTTQKFSKVLVTVGRKPNTDQLGLDKIGIKPNSQGFIEVNSERRTSVANIFAIGDVAGQPLLAHKGSKEGIVAAEVIAGQKVIYDVAAIPAVIFTDPEVATVGLTEAEAKGKGFDVGVGVFPFAANGRALSVNEPEGFVKIVSDKRTDKVLGVHIVGPEASQLIAEATLAIEMGACVEDLALTVHAHPTLPESLMEAAEAVHQQAIHIYQKKAPTVSVSAVARA